jgi:3,4-dihydroxy-2-butanone 4-phosphate synthase
MVQGGGLDENMAPKSSGTEPIQNEANNGLKNNRGTLAMARTGDPHSATGQFFINHKDTFTGISDYDRALTSKSFAEILEESSNLSELESREKVANNFRIPGHVPICIADSKLLKSRQGHTELIVSLLKLADMNPVALGCEMIGQDGNSLSSEEAKIWASNKGYLFLEGRQIMESCQ